MQRTLTYGLWWYCVISVVRSSSTEKKKGLKILRSVYRRTDHIIPKRKRTNGQSLVDKTLPVKLKTQ